MATTDNKAAKGKEIEGLLTLVATEMRKGAIPETVAKAFCDLAYRVQALESIVSEDNLGTRIADEIDAASLKVGGVDVKTKQTAKSSPSASSTAIAFIDTLSQDTNGVVSATKKTVRTATASQTGVTKVYTSTGDSTDGTMTRKAISEALAGKQDTLSSSDSGKVVAVGSTGSIIASVADVNDVNNIANYNRVHVEAIRGVSAQNNPTYMNVGLYRYDSNTAVMMPEQTGELNPGELIGTPVEILQFTNQNWNPMQLNCEDFVIIKNGYTSDLTDIWQLGKIVSNPKCRRFRVRFANADSYDWYINFCHTYNAGAYSGSISLITNKLGRYQTYYQVKVRPNKCVKIDIVLSTVGYNLSGDIIAIIDSDEPDEIT